MPEVEPTSEPRVRVDYVIYANVAKVERKHRILGIYKMPIKNSDGTDCLRQDTEDMGWYVHFEGSAESLFFGMEQPSLAIGDVVKITFEKQEPTDAKPE